MQAPLVTVAVVALLGLVSGCAAERQQVVAGNSYRCRDSLLLQTCNPVDPSGDAVTDEEAESRASAKGKLAGKSSLDRRGALTLIRPHETLPPPSPTHVPEQRSMRPPPPHH
jgi:hypothetical protein